MRGLEPFRSKMPPAARIGARALAESVMLKLCLTRTERASFDRPHYRWLQRDEKDSVNLDSAEDTVLRGAGASPDLDAPRSGLTNDARPDGHGQQFGRDYKIPGR